MTLYLTKDILTAAYDYLETTPPFNKWNLPPGEEIDFIIGRTDQEYGRHWADDKHHISISCRAISRYDSLIQVMAHEMIHVYQAQTRTWTKDVVHNKSFHSLAEKVCKLHGYDVKIFIG